MAASTSSHLGVLQVKESVVLGDFRGDMGSGRGGYARLTTADAMSAPTSPAVAPSLEQSHSAGPTPHARRLHDSSPFSPVGQPLPPPPSTHQQHSRLPPMSKDGAVTGQGRYQPTVEASPRLPPIATLVNPHPHHHHHHHGATGVTANIARLSLSPTEMQRHHEHSQHSKHQQPQPQFSPPSHPRDVQGSPGDQNRYLGLGKRERESAGMSRSVSLNGLANFSPIQQSTGLNGPQSKRMRVDELVSRSSSNEERSW